jgi:uncharacterized protein with PIN domain
MKFLADGMLGKLTRWLRLAGHDVIYLSKSTLPPEKQDEDLLQAAKSGERILLTSDVQLHKRAIKAGLKSVLIRGTDVASQLAEISRRLGVKMEIAPENSRCPLCNGKLDPVERSSIEKLVPENVLKTSNLFWRCTECQKIYWRGRHWEKIIETVKQYRKAVG